MGYLYHFTPRRPSLPHSWERVKGVYRPPPALGVTDAEPKAGRPGWPDTGKPRKVASKTWHQEASPGTADVELVEMAGIGCGTQRACPVILDRFAAEV